MRDRIDDFVRRVLRAISGLLAAIGGAISGWVRGGDVTVLIVLAVVALLLLFVLVPNRRRY
ncbi:MAG: hypothetical protein P8177_12645 [Gemmatimonadota bacterium]|jgi:hypothetical protein